MKRYFIVKTNFFQLRKIFTSEYIKHASGTQRKPTFFACFIPQTTQTNKERIREIFKKIGRARLHPFPLFLFLLLFLPANEKALLTYCLTSIYISFMCVSFVTYTNTAHFTFIPLLCFVSSFQCFVLLYIRFRSVSFSLSLSS